jgi:hypothetical protein
MFRSAISSSNPARTLIAAAIASAALASSAQAVTFLDGVFNNPDWTLTTITNAGGAGSFTNGFQMPVGGNPNQYRIIRNTLSINGANSALVGVHMNVTAFYNPSGGAISVINYSEDSKNFLNQGGNGQGSGCAIIQGGRTYIQRNPILVMPYSGFSNWQANPAGGLVAADFFEIDNAGNLFAGNNPDFSTSGGTMQFGFYRSNSSGNQTSGTFNSECGIDNWSVNIVTVPTPGSLALAGLGGLLTTRRRR